MYPNQVSVDYEVLASNFRLLQAVEPKTALVPVIKSDAYGHGAVETAQALIAAGAERLAVFRLEEAVYLRSRGIADVGIWVLLGALPDEAAVAARYDFTLVCYDLEQAAALSRAATHDMTVHVAVDTGMGRLGFPVDKALVAIEAIRAMPHLRVRGICSHIANAGNPEHPVTRRQTEGFRSLLAKLPPECTENHSCASTAWLSRLLPELPFARPGICLYIETELPNGTRTRNAMTLKSRIVSLKRLPKGYSISYNSRRTLERDSLIGIAPMGYEDGYLRSLTDRSQALVRGKRVPLMGTVCMSMCMFDLTDVPGAAIGDEIVLMGSQGDDEITVAELAAIAGTTEHELLCGIGRKRLESAPRI